MSCRFHDLRHTSVALAIAEGAHSKTIQARMWHSSITVTLDRYGHLFRSSTSRWRQRSMPVSELPARDRLDHGATASVIGRTMQAGSLVSDTAR